MDGFSFIKFYWDGGFFMHPILLIMIAATAWSTKQFLNLTFNFTVNNKFFTKIKILVKEGRLHEAYQCCLTTSHPLSKIFVAIIYNSNKGQEVIESASHIEMQKVLPNIENSSNNILFLAKIVLIVGLFGTSASLIGEYMSSANAPIMTKNVALSLHPIVFSLFVAIPCFAVYQFLSQKEKNILNKYHELISEISHLVIFRPHMEVVNEDVQDNEYRRYGT